MRYPNYGAALLIFLGLIRNFVYSLKITVPKFKSFLIPSTSSSVVCQTSLFSATTITDPPKKLWWERLMFWKTNVATEEDATPTRTRLPCNAVLVLGGTGRAGREIVKACIDVGRDVVVAARNASRAQEVFADYDRSKLFIFSGVDVTNHTTLPPNLFDGVDQLVSALGPVFGDAALTSDAIDYRAVSSMVGLFKSRSGAEKSAKAIGSDMKTPLVSFASPSKAETLKLWSRLDDVIMGGRSSSAWESIGKCSATDATLT
jgi:hypothetical protein